MTGRNVRDKLETFSCCDESGRDFWIQRLSASDFIKVYINIFLYNYIVFQYLEWTRFKQFCQHDIKII